MPSKTHYASTEDTCPADYSSEPQYMPLVAGGQGRDAAEITVTAFAMLIVAGALIVVAAGIGAML